MSIFSSELSAKRPGIVEVELLLAVEQPLGRWISLSSSHCVVWFENVLPRKGVAIVTTRRIDGLGSKKNVSCSFLIAFASALIAGERLVADQPPIVVAALVGLQPRDQPAHAVADQHHLVERRFLVAGIERLAGLGQIAAQLGGAEPKRLAARIEIEPELVAVCESPAGCADR